MFCGSDLDGDVPLVQECDMASPQGSPCPTLIPILQGAGDCLPLSPSCPHALTSGYVSVLLPAVGSSKDTQNPLRLPGLRLPLTKLVMGQFTLDPSPQ